jgi:hypothetical protein
MIRVAALAAALAVALAVGSEAPAKVEGRLFGLLGTQSGQFVLELDPTTLEPVADRRLKLAPAGPGAPWGLDPSRHTLAIARGQRLRLVDLPSLRFVGSVKLTSIMDPSGVLWLTPDRIVVLARGLKGYEALVVDAARLRVVSRRSLSAGSIVRSERTQSEVVILRAPLSGIGAANLLIVDGGGEAREIALPKILAGFERDTDAQVGTETYPGLALDHERRVAYVVSTGGLVAEVALDGTSVRYHALRGRFSKFTAGSTRNALFVGGRLVVTGVDSTTWKLPDGKPAMRTDPAGLDVIDPATWESRRLAANVSGVIRSGQGFLATGGTWSSVAGHKSGAGLVAYRADGSEQFRVLEGKRLWVATVYGNRAYAYAANEEMAKVVDLETRQVLTTRHRDLPWLLLEQNAPVW